MAATLSIHPSGTYLKSTRLLTYSPVSSIAPSENWDDDFEFHKTLGRSNPDNHTTNTRPSPVRTRQSTASSTVTEDWDNESTSHDKHSNLENDSDTSQLSNWVEPGPSTPTKRLLNHHSSTENWDDDFEDKTDSPARKSPSTKHIKARQVSDPVPRTQENWDDEFDLSPVKPSHLPQPQHYSISEDGHARYHDLADDDDDDDDDDDMDFNLDKEEDRTVTARSRRAALSRLAPTTSTPPPPVPPIPLSLLPTTAPHEQPFPRSPATSVFSVPTSGRDSVAYSYTSTSHLRPTVSRSSITGFANLPPSPPIHKERERRRLRKKSRPQEPAMEMNARDYVPGMYAMNSSRESFGIRESDTERRSRPITPRSQGSPSPPVATSPEPMSTPRTNRNSVSSSAGLPSPPTKTPLLSRIGSVKKWGVRKKRASSTPSELLLQEAEQRGDTEYTPNVAGLPTPSTPSSKPNWFFRATSSSSNGNAAASSSKYDINDHQTPKASTRGLPLPHAPGAVPNVPDLPVDTPSKLIKRKSLGFVQLRRGQGPINDVDSVPVPVSSRQPPANAKPNAMTSSSDLPSDLEAELGLDSDVAAGRSPSKRKKNRHSTTRPQQSRHGSYGGIGLGRAGDSNGKSTEDLGRQRSRARSFSRSKSREPKRENEPKDRDEAEGSRGFMGSVRRISLVGRHKRTKSGVSLSSVSEGLKRSLEHRKETSDDAMDVDPDPPPRSSGLLPPIELQPPSPPRVASDDTLGKTAQAETPPPVNLDALLLPSSSSPNSSSSPSLVLKSSAAKTPAPYTASLGRSTIAPVITASTSLPGSSSNVPRRNSLGDLKIPARISQAQVSLRRDLGMVKEFANNVEQLKNLQTTYHNLVVEVQGILDAHAHQVSSRAASPILRPLSRMRSGTLPSPSSPSQDDYKLLAAAFYTINSKYKIAWECAELLIELGGGSAAESTPTSPPPTSTSAPVMAAPTPILANQGKKSRERAITLSGEQSKPSTPTPGSGPSNPPLANPNMAWRASTGRHDLNQRQLHLLREMLNRSESSFVTENTYSPIVEDPAMIVNREWRWGDAMNSTITLPSEESSNIQTGGTSPAKKRRSSRMKGMSGLRDMLRSLTKNQATSPPPVPVSTTSLSTESSDSHHYSHGKIPTYGRRRAKTSSGPDASSSIRDRDGDVRPNSPYNASSLSAKASPRRPSLASIFRIGGKSKPSPTPSTLSSSGAGVSTDNVSHTRESSNTSDDEDWDRLEYPHDMESATRVRNAPTIRGRSPYMKEVQLPPHRPTTPNQRSTSSSQPSLWAGEPSASPTVGVPARATRLSNVEENVDDARASKTSLKQPSSSPVQSKKINKTGSVRSMPPQPLLPDKLAMTPENIKPLLENAKEVHARLTDCIGEIRSLLVAS